MVLLVFASSCEPARGSKTEPESSGSPSRGGCARIALDPRPTWAFHGQWSPGGETLVVTDVGAGILRTFDREGRAVRTVARPSGSARELNRPNRISRLAAGYLMQDRSRLVWLDAELEPVRSYGLEDVPVAPGGTVRALFDWAASEERLFGAGDVLLPDGSWRRGLLSMPLDDPAGYRLLREIPVARRQEFDHYLMGYPHVAVIDERGFFLALSEPPSVLEARGGGGAKRLASFPEGFEKLPALPLHGGFESAEVRYRAYERAALPVGLYARGQRLYLLTRAPAPDRGTRWTLSRIDPDEDRLEGSVTLPTRAEHVSLVPGPERWAVLEKGRVERYGQQEIASLLLIPGVWIEQEGSPLASEDPVEGLCGAS